MALVAALGCQKPSPGPPAECAVCTWQRLVVHPQAAAQPTATGKALMTLCPWRGRLYIGYGDYQANTGPIDITAWDPALGRLRTVHTSDTEANYNYRAIGDALWAPATDRRTRADYAVGEPWRDERPVTTAHAYDIATLDGGDLADRRPTELVAPGRRQRASPAQPGGARWRALRRYTRCTAVPPGRLAVMCTVRR